jgi:hypothetical protein
VLSINSDNDHIEVFEEILEDVEELHVADLRDWDQGESALAQVELLV